MQCISGIGALVHVALILLSSSLLFFCWLDCLFWPISNVLYRARVPWQVFIKDYLSQVSIYNYKERFAWICTVAFLCLWVRFPSSIYLYVDSCAWLAYIYIYVYLPPFPEMVSMYRILSQPLRTSHHRIYNQTSTERRGRRTAALPGRSRLLFSVGQREEVAN